jgi:hypothetical protein
MLAVPRRPHGLPLRLHPAKPVTIEQVRAYDMTSALDNTIALTRIIMAGILDEFPELELVCPHLGGALPDHAQPGGRSVKARGRRGRLHRPAGIRVAGFR